MDKEFGAVFLRRKRYWLLNRLKPQTCPPKGYEPDFQRARQQTQGLQSSCQKLDLEQKALPKNSRKWHSPKGCEDADRPLDLNSVRHSFLGSGWLQGQERESPHAGGTGCQTVS